MENLIVAETDSTPSVVLDKQQGKFILEGKSFPENAYGFYATILDWMEKYAKGPNSKTEFDFKLEYFNTPSAKKVLDILKVLERIKLGGLHVLIRWHYGETDKDMHDAGKIYTELLEVPFEFVSYKLD